MDASPNANACRLKNGTLSLSLSFWKGLFWPSGVGSYFFRLQKDREPERCTCHAFWNSTLLIWSWRMEFMRLCVSVPECS